ncbi:pyruvate dehydrogenase complex dihydrolipoamide acetyltransferase, partial [Clavibacter phaseoli]
MHDTETAPATASGSGAAWPARRPAGARRVARPLAVASALALGLCALVASPAEAATATV